MRALCHCEHCEHCITAVWGPGSCEDWRACQQEDERDAHGLPVGDPVGGALQGTPLGGGAL